MDIIDLTIIALIALIPTFIAKSKGRDPIKWWIYSFLLLPFAVIHSLFIKSNTKALLESGEFKKCPFCAELIKPEAITCKYCGKDIEIKEAN